MVGMSLKRIMDETKLLDSIIQDTVVADNSLSNSSLFGNSNEDTRKEIKHVK